MHTIKDASEKDIPIIQDLAEKTWWPSYGSILRKEQISYMLATIYSGDAMLKAMQDGSQRFLVLFSDDVPAGFASYGVWPEAKDQWKIHKLYVLPEFQGSGFGRKLLDEIVARARTAKVGEVLLNVNRHNPAFHFYKAYGFTVLREEDIPIGDYWMNDYVMITLP